MLGLWRDKQGYFKMTEYNNDLLIADAELSPNDLELIDQSMHYNFNNFEDIVDHFLEWKKYNSEKKVSR